MDTKREQDRLLNILKERAFNATVSIQERKSSLMALRKLLDSELVRLKIEEQTIIERQDSVEGFDETSDSES